MARGKHKATKRDELRKQYRAACPRHVVTFEAVMDEDTKRHVFSYADSLRVLGNELTGIMNKRIEQMLRTKKYRALKAEYTSLSEKMKQCDAESEAYEKHESARKAVGSRMAEVQKECGVSFEALRNLAKDRQKCFGVSSVHALTRAEDIWQACEKILYGDGRKLHFKRRRDLPIVRAKQIDKTLVLNFDEEGNIVFTLNKEHTFGITYKKDDIFLHDEYAALKDYLWNPNEEEALDILTETGEVVPVFRPCYASLKCIRMRGKLRVYVQITIAAQALSKRRKDGTPRHDFSAKGRVGCDIGTQSAAVVSSTGAELFNLAERDGVSTKRSLKRIVSRQRKMARSLTKSNPSFYLPDGRRIKGKRGRLRKSKHYGRLEFLVREQQRRDAASRAYAIRTDANRLRMLGDELITEPANARALQKRAKGPAQREDRLSEVRDKHGNVRTVHKFKRKKRFGKSILFRCPGGFRAALEKRFGAGYHEVDKMFRASQYDHVSDTYTKKKLSERWHQSDSGDRIQRDLYSAFLMFCSNDVYKAPDRQRCLSEYDDFRKRHDQCVETIRMRQLIICNSGISI